jgi:hypothetical protein
LGAELLRLAWVIAALIRPNNGTILTGASILENLRGRQRGQREL